MSTYKHPATGQTKEYVPYNGLSLREQRVAMFSSDDDKIKLIKDGIALDKFIKDYSLNVRCAVAQEGFGLEKLVDDKSTFVRREVALQGYGLDKLAYDESDRVKQAVNDYLTDNYETNGDYWTGTLGWWIENNPDKCALEKNQPKKTTRAKVDSSKVEEQMVFAEESLNFNE